MDLASARRLLSPDAAQLPWSTIPALRERPPHAAVFESLWVKPGRHFNVSYRLSRDGMPDTDLAAAFLLSERRAAQLADHVKAHSAGSHPCLHCHTAYVGGGVVLQLFPADYRLPTLPAAFDLKRVNDAAGTRFREVAPSGYRPGIRCQVRYVDADGSACYGKVAVEATTGPALRFHRQVFESARAYGGFDVAEPVAYLDALHLSLVRAAPGQSLHQGLHDETHGRDAVEQTARALEAFHELPIAAERVYASADEVSLVRSWVALIAAMYPEFAAPLRAAEDELLRHTPSVATPTLVHRDFYDKQVLIAASGVTLLDLDTSCAGDAEIDVGNFCAHLRLRGQQWNQVAQHRALEECFLGAYPRRIEPERAAWYRRMALLRLACGYALRPHWRALVPALVEEVWR